MSDITETEVIDAEVVKNEDTKRAVAADIASTALKLAASKSLVAAEMCESLAIAHALGCSIDHAGKFLDQGELSIVLEQAEVSRDEATRLVKFSRDWTLVEIEQRKADALRQGVLTLGWFPAKERIEHEGDQAISTRSGLVTITNHWRRYMSALLNGRAEITDQDQARVDTRDLYDWLCVLHGDAKNASISRNSKGQFAKAA